MVGAAVAVVQRDGEPLFHCAGRRSVAEDGDIDENTLFQIGSVTKSFTGAAAALIATEQGVSLDTPVSAILPRMCFGEAWTSLQITLRDLLVHRAGLSVNIYPYLAPFSEERALEQLRHMRPSLPFRDCYQYDNLMYAVAGKAIEALSGHSWRTCIRERLFAPLGMTRSLTSTSEVWSDEFFVPTFMGSGSRGQPLLSNAKIENVAMPHGYDDSGEIVPIAWQGYDNTAAAGAIISSAADMSSWLEMHLNHGRCGMRQVIPEDVMEDIHAAHNLRTAAHQFQGLEGDRSYALGWERAAFRGHRHLAHGGGIIGFPSYAAMLPDLGLGIVVLANGPKERAPDYTLEQLFHKAISLEIFDRILGLEDEAWSPKFLALRSKGREFCASEEDLLQQGRILDTIPSLPLDCMTGRYVDQAGNSGPVRVTKLENTLSFAFEGEGAYSATLAHWHADIFRLKQAPSTEGVLGAQFVTFVVDPRGAVIGLRAFGEYGGLFERVPDGEASQ